MTPRPGPPSLNIPKRKKHAGDVESFQPSIVQTISDTVNQLQPIPNEFSSPNIGGVTLPDPRNRPTNPGPICEFDQDYEEEKIGWSKKKQSSKTFIYLFNITSYT